MGVISILLGLIAFFSFTAAGAITASFIEKSLTKLSTTFTTMENLSNTTITTATISIFVFIGLLICVNFVMHGLTYMNKTRYNTSIRYICAALGLITILCQIMVGLYVARLIVDNKDLLSLFGFLSNIPNHLLYYGIVGIFTFIGLLMFMNLLMHGLTYNKVAKMQVHLRRHG